MLAKKYKVRVEHSFIAEFDVDAVHEDEAAAIAERAGYQNLEAIIETLNRVHVPNYAVKCIEVNEYEE